MPGHPNFPTPLDFMDFALQQQRLTMDAAETIWHRSTQIALGKMSPVENMSMWMEKPTAMARGFEKAAVAAVAGKSPAQIMHAAMAPMTAKASANAKRLRK